MPAFLFVLKSFAKRRKIFRSHCALEVVPTSSAWVERPYARSKVALDPSYLLPSQELENGYRHCPS